MYFDPAGDLVSEMIQVRRDIHSHPELGFQERRTSTVVAERLRLAGIEVHEGVGGTGVVGVLRNGKCSRSLALRADLDALPLLEQQSCPHRSTTNGVMHACGHDGHTAMLLGAALHLHQRKSFNGTVYLIFQPAEEGLGGAKAMLADGLFERFPADYIFGMHNMPGIAAGSLATRTGAIMASADHFTVRLQGKGGHAALPHTTVDPVVIGAQMVSAMQAIVSRTVDPLGAAVLSVTHVHAGEPSFNIIPDEAIIMGGIRTLAHGTRERILQAIKQLCETMPVAMGATAELELMQVFPVLENSSSAIELVASACGNGDKESPIDLSHPPMMTSDDFAFLAQHRPGAYVFIGNGTETASQPLHSPKYDFNDAIIPSGMEFWCRLVESYLV
jgi:hippurate hydrolase